MKIILVVIDGLADKRIKDLDNKTPLEAANTPNMDKMAKSGLTGQVFPFIEKDKLPTSEDAHLALLGYDPENDNPGRGVFEVAGIGMDIKAGDVALRGNFATLGLDGLILDRRAGRIEETEELIEAISNIKIRGVESFIKKAVSHRIGIIMRGKGLSSKISSGDPKKEGAAPLKIMPRDNSQEAVFTAEVLNEFLEKSYDILKNHPKNKQKQLPANYILVRGAGTPKNITSFSKKYGLKAAFVAGGALYKGIARILDMEEIKVEGANGLPGTNLSGKILAAKNALKEYDFVFCHIKAADNLAEDGKFKEKKELIERIDQSFGPFLDLKNTTIAVTADHATCSESKSHCLESVPLLIYNSEIKNDNRVKFSEASCKEGELKGIEQIDLMEIILTIAKKI